MKKRIYIVLLAALTHTTACNDFLDTTSPSEFTPDVVYNDASMTELALMGIYSKLTEDATYSQDLAFTLNCGSDIEIRSFTLGAPAGSTDRAAANYLATAGNRQTTRAATALYVAIERANLVIEGIEGAESYINRSNSDIVSAHAEAVTLRAQCYRDLIRLFGNVPFKIESTATDLSNVYLPKTDRFTIMETLIDQLIACADELPWKQSTPERITQGYCRGLAAQLALMRAGWNFTTDCTWQAPKSDAATYYAIAKEQCAKVIESGQYALTSSFADFFYGQCQRNYQPEESLFEVGFVVARSSELGYTVGPRLITTTTRYGYATQGQIFTTPEYFYSFAPDDQRRDVSVYYTEYRDISKTATYPNGVTSTTGVSENIIGNAQQFRIGKWDPTWFKSDFASASYAAGGKIGTGVNYVMMRYSDILLMYAEAENALNGATQSAKDALYEVRSRAIPTLSKGSFETYLSTKTFQQAVEDERRWEFIGEGLRKWDLLRWGKLTEAIVDMRNTNWDLVANWHYDFEFATTTVGGTTVQRALPQTLYYRYDGNNELITDINIDYAMDDPQDGSWFESNTGKVWIWGQTNQKTESGGALEQYRQYLDEFASGLVDASGALVSGGRPFYPIPGDMITDYNGILKQDYGY